MANTNQPYIVGKVGWTTVGALARYHTDRIKPSLFIYTTTVRRTIKPLEGPLKCLLTVLSRPSVKE